MARTSLITLIFFSPNAARTISKLCFSSAAASPPSAPGAAAATATRRGRRNAPLLFEKLGQIGRLEDGEVGKVFGNLFDICSHFYIS